MKKYVSIIGVAIGGLLLIFLIIVSAAPSVFTEYSPIRQDISHTLSEPTEDHPYGTDRLGRDVEARLIYGLRSTLGISALSTLIAMVSGAFLGAIDAAVSAVGIKSGLLGPSSLSRAFRITASVFGIPLVLGYIAARGVSFGILVSVTPIILLPNFARVFKALFFTLFSGDRTPKTQLRMLFAPLAQIPLSMALAVTIITSLGFIGLGIQPPMTELGAMIADGRNLIRSNFSLFIYPWLVLTALLFALTVLGESLKGLLCSDSDYVKPPHIADDAWPPQTEGWNQ